MRSRATRRGGPRSSLTRPARRWRSVFEELQASAAAGPEIAPREYPALFAALIERIAVRRRGGVDPRIHIWGALEARLQSVDKVVLGGLNEGTWPAQTRLDPLLSRPMREALDARAAGAPHRPCRARFRAGARAPGSLAHPRRPRGRRAEGRVALAAAAHRPCRRRSLPDAMRKRGHGDSRVGAHARRAERDRSADAPAAVAARRAPAEAAFGDAHRDADPRPLRDLRARGPAAPALRAAREASRRAPSAERSSTTSWKTSCASARAGPSTPRR